MTAQTTSTKAKTHHPNDHCLPIAAVSDGRSRPQWSVLIPTHNCGKFLEQTLSSVLLQDPGPEQMEIIVVDDCSTQDDPSEVVERLGKGRVRLIRQPTNVGKARNFQTGLEASRGIFIHQLHGDDMVCDGFYQSMELAFAEFPAAGAFFCESEYIDENGSIVGVTGKESSKLGILDGWLDRLVIAQRIQTPSIVVRRQVYETLGGFDNRLPNFEDWEMWVRIATRFPFCFNPEITAKYRGYPASTSTQSVVAGERATVFSRAIAIMDSYLPAEVVSRCHSARAREAAHYLIRCVPQARAFGDFGAWWNLCCEVLRYSVRPRELYYLAHFSLFYRRYVN